MSVMSSRTDGGPGEPVTLWSLREDVRVVPDATGPGISLAGESGDCVRLDDPPPVVRAALRRMTMGPVLLGNLLPDTVSGAGSSAAAVDAAVDADVDADGVPTGLLPDAVDAAIEALLRDARAFVVRTLRSEDALGPLLSLVPRGGVAGVHLERVPWQASVRLDPAARTITVPGAGMRVVSDRRPYEVLFHRPEACWLIGRLATPSSVDAVTRDAPLPLPIVVASLDYLHSAGLLLVDDRPDEHSSDHGDHGDHGDHAQLGVDVTTGASAPARGVVG